MSQCSQPRIYLVIKGIHKNNHRFHQLNRLIHNPKVVSSNPVSAAIEKRPPFFVDSLLLYFIHAVLWAAKHTVTIKSNIDWQG